MNGKFQIELDYYICTGTFTLLCLLPEICFFFYFITLLLFYCDCMSKLHCLCRHMNFICFFFVCQNVDRDLWNICFRYSSVELDMHVKTKTNSFTICFFFWSIDVYVYQILLLLNRWIHFLFFISLINWTTK